MKVFSLGVAEFFLYLIYVYKNCSIFFIISLLIAQQSFNEYCGIWYDFLRITQYLYFSVFVYIKCKSMDTLSSTKEAGIYNGKKTTSLTSGAGKTGQPLVKE